MIRQINFLEDVVNEFVDKAKILTSELLDRFWMKVKILEEDRCWEWKAAKQSK